MIKFTLLVELPGIDPLSEYQAQLNNLFWLNVSLLLADIASGIDTPLVLATCRYQKDPYDEWLTISKLLRRKVGDCEDLSCALAAELYVYCGIDVRPYIYKPTPTGPYHVIVTGPNIRIDPSELLGMSYQRYKHG